MDEEDENDENEENIDDVGGYYGDGGDHLGGIHDNDKKVVVSGSPIRGRG